MININFKSENFQIDFLSFNIQVNDDEQIQRIANYLSNTFQCNSKFEDKKNPNLNKTLVIEDKNICQVVFITNQVKHWSGVSLDFAGNHAKYFYEAIKSKELDWDIMDFANTNLGRIDLYYDRKLIKTDKIEDFDLFLENCEKQINLKFPKISVQKDNNILRIGSRTSSNFFRVYKRENGRDIRFELEIKKIAAKKYQHYLFTRQFDKFEDLLSTHFYKQAVKVFFIKSYYTDWLIHNFRKGKKITRKEIVDNPFAMSYLTYTPLDDFKEDFFKKEEFLYQLFQLLTYVRNLQSYREWLGHQDYRNVFFPINNFLEFTGKDKDSQYQIQKLVSFLRALQKLNPRLEHVWDDGFESAVIFPFFKITKTEGWYLELTLAEELYLYTYPFNLPHTFLFYENTDDLRVKLLFIKSFAVRNIEKELPTENFLAQFSISNSRTSGLKKSIVQLMHKVQDSKLIEPGFLVVTKKNQIKKVDKLNSSLVSKAKSVFYIENTHLKNTNLSDNGDNLFSWLKKLKLADN